MIKYILLNIFKEKNNINIITKAPLSPTPILRLSISC